MERVAGAIEARRDELARTLTLDQGKPLMAEAYGEVEELHRLLPDGRRGGDPAGRPDAAVGGSPTSGSSSIACRAAWSASSRPGTGRTRCPASSSPRPSAAGNTVVWNPATNTSLCATVLAACLADADLPAGVFNLVTGPGSEVGDAIAGDPRTRRRRLHRLDRGRPAGRRSGRPARTRSWRWAATARSSSSTTPTSTPRSRRRSRRPS